MAIGLVKSASVEKGPFTNAMMALGGERFDGAAYLGCDGDGKPVSLTLRFSLADLNAGQVTALHKNAPIRDGDAKLWRWSDGTQQPVGRKGSRWTVGGPRIITSSRGRQVAAVAETPEAPSFMDAMVNDVLAVMPVAARGKLTAAQQKCATKHNLSAGELRSMARMIDRRT